MVSASNLKQQTLLKNSLLCGHVASKKGWGAQLKKIKYSNWKIVFSHRGAVNTIEDAPRSESLCGSISFLSWEFSSFSVVEVPQSLSIRAPPADFYFQPTAKLVNPSLRPHYNNSFFLSFFFFFSLCQEYLHVEFAEMLQLLFSSFQVRTMKKCRAGCWSWRGSQKGEVHTFMVTSDCWISLSHILQHSTRGTGLRF